MGAIYEVKQRITRICRRNYQLKAKQIDDDHRKQEQAIPKNALTSTGESLRIVKLLPWKLRAKGQALLDSYFEAFELEGKSPDQDDQVALDKKLENLFRGGLGDHTGSLGISTLCETQGIEQELCEQMRLRAKRMSLRLKRGNGMEKLKVRWSQLPQITEPKVYRVPGIGDVEVRAEDIHSANSIGGDPWVELCECTTFGHNVRQYTLGFFTPA